MSSKKTILVLPLERLQPNHHGAFIQKIRLKANDWLDIETGLRGDYVHEYGFSILPRVSAYFKISP
jgi:iron complex outermembrane receptor protein